MIERWRDSNRYRSKLFYALSSRISHRARWLLCNLVDEIACRISKARNDALFSKETSRGSSFSHPWVLLIPSGHSKFLSRGGWRAPPERIEKRAKECRRALNVEREKGKRISERKKEGKEGSKEGTRRGASSGTSLLGYWPPTLSLTLLLRPEFFSPRYLIKFSSPPYTLGSSSWPAPVRLRSLE